MSIAGPLARYVGSGLLTLAVAVAGLQLGVPAAGIFGYHTYTVLTASMAPTLPVGSLIVDESIPAASARPGDVITFALPTDPSLTVTHRVVRLAGGPAGGFLLTRGDANAVADAWRVPAGEKVGRVLFEVPLAGYVGTLWGRLLLAFGAVLWILRPKPSQRRPVVPETVPA